MAHPIVASMPFLAYHSSLDAQAYQPDDLAMDVESYWESGVLDSYLRDGDSTMAYYSDWSESAPWTPFIAGPANMVPSFQVQACQKTYNRPYEATGPIPRPYEQARGSPTSSSRSSITSPSTDPDWPHDSYHHHQPMDDYSLSPSASESRGPQEPCWDAKSLPHSMAGLINMSIVQSIPDPEVQGIPNPQEVAFHMDEYDIDVDTRIEAPMEAENRPGTKAAREHYGLSNEDAVALSPHGGTSEVNHSEPVTTENAEGDVDAEGEDVDEFDENMHETDEAVEDEEDRDFEYKPKASRGKGRRPSRTSSSSAGNKKHKVSKKSRTSRLQCKTCDYHAKDAAVLARHVMACHTRPYVCTFSFAGCSSTFGNKNEWKRHVSSQHIGLQHWVCSEGTCPLSSSRSTAAIKETNSARAKLATNVFNRKDLFTQHLKRMHAPNTVRQGKNSSTWDERVKELQSSCLVIRRNPPSKTKCPVRQCGQIFEGANSWDDRMEHVGRHLEKGSGGGGGHASVAHDDMEQESDEFMIQWAIQERIIEARASGYRFCKHGARADDVDSDAEGDEE